MSQDSSKKIWKCIGILKTTVEVPFFVEAETLEEAMEISSSDRAIYEIENEAMDNMTKGWYDSYDYEPWVSREVSVEGVNKKPYSADSVLGWEQK